jgi:hypothetical protein
VFAADGFPCKFYNLIDKKEENLTSQSFVRSFNDIKFYNQNRMKKFSMICRPEAVSSSYFNRILSFTRDNKYALFNKGDLLVGMIQFGNSPSPVLRNFYSPRSIYDNYFQNKIEFYNVIDAIKSTNFSILSPKSSQIVFGQYRFTITHVLCYYGESKSLQLIFNDNFILIPDIFGNSPFYYAIKRKHQECVNNLLEFIISLFATPYAQTMQFQSILLGLRNDFSLIVQKFVETFACFLKTLMVSSKIIFAKVSIENLPLFHYNGYSVPILTDFIPNQQNNIDEIPVLLQYSLFPLDCSIDSKESFDILQSIFDCKNDQIFLTPFIQYFIKLQ